MIFLNLNRHQPSYQNNLTKVGSWISLYHNLHTFFKGQVIAIMVISFSGIFELHLHQITFLTRMRDITQPIHYRQHMFGIMIDCLLCDMA